MDRRTMINIQGATDGFLDRQSFIDREGSKDKPMSSQIDRDKIMGNENNLQHNNQPLPPNSPNVPGFNPANQNAINQFRNKL